MFTDSNGLMYASRRQYLTVPSQPPYKIKRITASGQLKKEICRDQVLRPPDSMFLTRAQARRLHVHSKRQHHLKYKATEKQKNRRHHKRENSSSVINFDYSHVPAQKPDIPHDLDDRFQEAKDTIAQRKSQSWEQVKEAGVVFWRNTMTGEATLTNPSQAEVMAELEVVKKKSTQAPPEINLFPSSPRSAEELADLSSTSSFSFMASDDWLSAVPDPQRTREASRFPPIR